MVFLRSCVIAALVVTAFFTALASSTSARGILFSSPTIRVVFRPLVFISNTGDRVSCTVTLEGRFHEITVPKFPGNPSGNITTARADEANCRSGPTTGIRGLVRGETLPWSVTYVDFSGALPSARVRFKINRASFFLLSVPILGRCGYVASFNVIFTGPAGGGINEGQAYVTAENGFRINSETAFCPAISFSGTAPATLGFEIPITLRLI